MRTPVAERIWVRIDRRGDDECWPWTGCQDGNGYGMVFEDERRRGRRAHRVAYEVIVGPVPVGLQLDHLCRNRLCCNPAHLEPVTKHENWRRGMSFSAIEARQTHCKRGHALTPENLERTVTDRRSCRKCMALRSAKWKEHHPEWVAVRRERRAAIRLAARMAI